MIVIHELRQQFKLDSLLKLAKIKRSTFYYFLKSIRRPDKYEVEKELILQIYDEHQGRYGYRRIQLELRNRGYLINHKTVQKLMNQLNLKSVVRIKKYRSFKGNIGKTAPNRLERNFKANQPNEKWVTDVTEFRVCGTKLYLSPILDLYNGEIISYNLSERAQFNQITEMLVEAFSIIPSTQGITLHSDQGWQYQMPQYQRLLRERGIEQSMSRKGNCLDNAVIESFFGILKSELLYIKRFESVNQFILELEAYIDYYNTKRIKLRLNGMSPVQYRLNSLKIA